MAVLVIITYVYAITAMCTQLKTGCRSTPKSLCMLIERRMALVFTIRGETSQTTLLFFLQPLVMVVNYVFCKYEAGGEIIKCRDLFIF